MNVLSKKNATPIILSILLAQCLTMQCAQPTPQHFSRQEEAFVRRMPVSAVVDDGHPDIANTTYGSMGYQYLAREQGVQIFTESTYVAGNFSSLTTKSTSYMYMARHLLSFQFSVSPLNYLSMGMTGYMSMGDIIDGLENTAVSRNVYELGWFIRASTSFRNFSVGFRPMIVFYTVNGSLDVFNDSLPISGASIHKYGVASVLSLAVRYQVIPKVAMFGGFQHKVVPYSLFNNDLKFENSLALNVGFGFKPIPQIEPKIYAVFPLKTDYTNFTESPHAGFDISFILGGENSEE